MEFHKPEKTGLYLRIHWRASLFSAFFSIAEPNKPQNIQNLKLPRFVLSLFYCWANLVSTYFPSKCDPVFFSCSIVTYTFSKAFVSGTERESVNFNTQLRAYLYLQIASYIIIIIIIIFPLHQSHWFACVAVCSYILHLCTNCIVLHVLLFACYDNYKDNSDDSWGCSALLLQSITFWATAENPASYFFASLNQI